MEFYAPCLFGLEGPTADQLRRLGLNGVRASDGAVRFSGAGKDMAKANVSLRFAERVLIELGSFDAASFDALFEGTASLPWEDFIPKNGSFPVKGHSLNSRLFSVPACQSIIKKAIAERLKRKYKISRFAEDGALFKIQFLIMKDSAALFIDTSGPGLHKRGYRRESVEAPLRETLAAALAGFAKYRGRGDFCDPFCGSGTIAIEAALIALNRAPGLNRGFSAEKWDLFEKRIWADAREEAAAAEFKGTYDIFAGDIDPKAVGLSEANAKKAGVGSVIRFETADAMKFSKNTERGMIVTNPPYGERMLEKTGAREIYSAFGKTVLPGKERDVFILSPEPDFESFFGARADKRRKLYNGMIKCNLYMYLLRTGASLSPERVNNDAPKADRP